MEKVKQTEPEKPKHYVGATRGSGDHGTWANCGLADCRRRAVHLDSDRWSRTNMAYNVGDRVRCTGTLNQTDGNAVDAQTVLAWYRSPAKNVTTLTYGTDGALIRSATGVYYFDLDVDAAGDWYYGFYSTGVGKAASPDKRLPVLSSKRG